MTGCALCRAVAAKTWEHDDCLKPHCLACLERCMAKVPKARQRVLSPSHVAGPSHEPRGRPTPAHAGLRPATSPV